MQAAGYEVYPELSGAGSLPSSVIQLIEVTKSYFLGKLEVPILHDISFEVQKGEFLGIMGPSGSGKSTLLNLIGCLDRPSRGQILIKDRDINKLSDKELAKLRGLEIGFVFQSFNLIPRLSALENVLLPTYANSKPGLKSQKRAKKLLNMLGLESRLQHKPSELSGGQAQRVAIARALINEPTLLLADEPTGALDSKSGAEILKLFKEFKGAGRTIIMITHDPKIASHADRILALKDGRIQKA